MMNHASLICIHLVLPLKLMFVIRLQERTDPTRSDFAAAESAAYRMHTESYPPRQQAQLMLERVEGEECG